MCTPSAPKTKVLRSIGAWRTLEDIKKQLVKLLPLNLLDQYNVSRLIGMQERHWHSLTAPFNFAENWWSNIETINRAHQYHMSKVRPREAQSPLIEWALFSLRTKQMNLSPWESWVNHLHFRNYQMIKIMMPIDHQTEVQSNKLREFSGNKVKEIVCHLWERTTIICLTPWAWINLAGRRI